MPGLNEEKNDDFDLDTAVRDLGEELLALPPRATAMLTLLMMLGMLLAAFLLFTLLTMGLVQLAWWLTKPLRKNPLTMRRETRPPRTP